MKKADYIYLDGLDEGAVVAALYAECGSAGLGAVRMLVGALDNPSEVALSDEDGRNLINGGMRNDGSWHIDYYKGRRMKLYCQTHRGRRRLYVAGYDEQAERPARKIIDAMRIANQEI